ncbi:ATP-binding protein [Anianabacter salinae]|uniref:ATP-binding protein n=1 Tax=Anianabacter salinae TaxID=2851023 RepID=UPI00225DE0ED|nr:ATP-binding protein [Anianabacter salinae]MBV0913342.1 ATP-binding protein [Anianabacter salinae]
MGFAAPPDAMLRAPRRVDRRCVFPATALSVRRVLENLMRDMRLAGFGADTCAELELLLAELMNNVVEHGRPRAAPGILDVKLTASRRGVAVEVRDDGRPLPPHLLCAPVLPAGDAAGAAEGGYGWPLIHMLGEGLRHDRQAGWNVTALRLRSGVGAAV